jgi:hypothetical protein
VDTFTYPFLFLVRHTLELGFKANIEYLSKYSKSVGGKQSNIHRLPTLHGYMKQHFEIVCKEHDIDRQTYNSFYEFSNKLEKLVDYFDRIDKKSYSFRYPVDLDGNINFDTLERVMLVEIKDKFDDAVIFLTHTIDVLGNLFTWIDYHEELLASYYNNC